MALGKSPDPCQIPTDGGRTHDDVVCEIHSLSSKSERSIIILKDCDRNLSSEEDKMRLEKGEKNHDEDFEMFSSKAETVSSKEESNEKGSLTTNYNRNEIETFSRCTNDIKMFNINRESEPNKRYVTPKDFELLKVIGMGAFGKVLQVRNKHNAKIFAMKVISKRLLKRGKGYVENIQAERNILTKVRHPFVVKCHCSFQTGEKLFIIMDFLAGGELFLRLGREGIFLEKTAAFYLGEIILALDHLHSLGILHRDLKPENILLSSDGHICVTDFGLARDLSEETGFGGFKTEEDESRARTICGTQEYMSPEMLSRKGYGRASDYWSLGCIAYEMLSGRPPFESRRGKGSKDLFRRIMTEKIKMPDGSTASACKLLKGLLNRNSTQRWGAARSTMFEVGGVSGLKSANFFAHLDWDKLELKQLEPPHNKPVENDEDLRHFYEEFKQMPLPRSVTEMSKDTFSPKRVHNGMFRGFSFVHDDFALPIRRNSELQRYWESNDDDRESVSETASSKIHSGGENVTNIDEKEKIKESMPKKKRPPRKRKKKNKGGSNQLSPAPSQTGEKVPISQFNQSNSGDSVVKIECNVRETHSIPERAKTTEQVKEADPQNVMKSTTPIAGVSKLKLEKWKEVKSFGKKKTLQEQKKTHKLGANVQSLDGQLNVPQQNNKPQFYTTQTLPGYTPSYRQTPGSWAARTNQQFQTSLPPPSILNHHSREYSIDRNKTLTKVNINSLQQTSSHVPPSPSGDWRTHSLARNLSPSIGSGQGTPRSASRQRRPDLSSFPAPPSFNTENFPIAGELKKSTTYFKPKGAWATRDGKPKR